MKELPSIARNGHLLEFSDPQPEIRKNAETASDWVYAGEAANLYHMATTFKNRFLDPILLTDRHRLPDPVISFENLRNRNTLAAYRLQRNPQGLLYDIIMNSQHFMDETVDEKTVKNWVFGKWAQYETLLHEQVHLWQQNFGKKPVKPGRSHHNKEFVGKCESIGLHPMPGVGYHTRLADGPFAVLMDEIGINPPDFPKQKEEINIDWFKWYLDKLGKRRKGKSSLHKWTCPECGLNARMGIKGDPMMRHEPCEQKTNHAVFFVRADGLNHTIYKDDKSNPSK